MIFCVLLVFDYSLHSKRMHAIGENKCTRFEPDFNRSVKIEFYDQRITSNAGVLLLRDADSRLNLANSFAQGLIDTRKQDAIRYQGNRILNAFGEAVYEIVFIPGRSFSLFAGAFLRSVQVEDVYCEAF